MTYEIITLGPSAADITGETFGRLTAIAPTGRTTRSVIIWLCICDCGNETTVSVGNLRSGNTRSCGCFQKECRAPTHGLSRNRSYDSWYGMRRRCLNKSSPDFHNYGGRGITICDRWKDSIKLFHADMGERPEGMTLDRINNSLGYSKENCRWATMQEQSNNTRRTNFITHNGETLTHTEWSLRLSKNKCLIRDRIGRGWSEARAVTQPVQGQHRH